MASALGRPLGQVFAARQGVLFERGDAGGGMDLDGYESRSCVTRGGER